MQTRCSSQTFSTYPINANRTKHTHLSSNYSLITLLQPYSKQEIIHWTVLCTQRYCPIAVSLENSYSTRCISPKTEASATLSAKNPTWNNDVRSLLCLLLPTPVGRFAVHFTSQHFTEHITSTATRHHLNSTSVFDMQDMSMEDSSVSGRYYG